MSETADATLSDGVFAALRVASIDADPSRGDAAVAEIAEAVRAAAGAALVVAWAHDPLQREGRVMAAAGLPDHGEERLAPLLAEAAGAPEAEVGPESPLAGALAALDAPRGLTLPLAAEGGVAGALLLAGAEPPGADPVAREAARVGARRIGELLDAIRLRGNLERAMAQILESDERMVGRMALDIHDGPTQQLSVAMLEVQLLEADLADAEATGGPAPDSLRPALERIYETVGGALHEMRELIGHLRPAQFEDRRLTDILQEAVAAFEARGDTRVETTWEGEFAINGASPTQRITLYRILQESLTNAHRHGRAGLVRVLCREDDEAFTLVVADDGVGFDPEAVQKRRPGVPLQRFGLHGMGDRAQMLGGTFEVTSTAGEGTTIRVRLPRWEGAPPEMPVDEAVGG